MCLSSLRPLAWALAASLMLAGCGGSGHDGVPVPRRVPPGAVAVVGRVAITADDLERWTPLKRGYGSARNARAGALPYLIESQWALQEAAAEGIDTEILRRLVARQLATSGVRPRDELSGATRAFEARVELVAAALRQRHGRASGHIGRRAITRYYAAHRSDFVVPAVRETRMVVTRSRAAARRARAALERGQGWATVARHFSLDPSAANGGAYVIAANGSPRKLVRAAFGAPRGRLVGPLRAALPAGPYRPTFYLFKVTGARPADPQSLAEVRAQIANRVREARATAALAAFERSFRRRWRRRTLCAPDHLVPACRNYRDQG